MSEADKPNFSEEQIEYLHSVTRESVLSGEETGFNLLGDLKNPRFGEIQKGYEALMWIPKVSTSFGTFHTHPKARARFSTGDIVSTIFKNQSVICIGGRGIKGVWTPKRVTYYTEVVSYVVEPLSEGYENLVKKREEYGSALSVGDWDKLKVIGQEIYELGQKAFEKYTYGEKLMSEKNPEKEEEEKPTLKELMTGKVLDGYLEAARVKPLNEFPSEDEEKVIAQIVENCKFWKSNICKWETLEKYLVEKGVENPGRILEDLIRRGVAYTARRGYIGLTEPEKYGLPPIETALEKRRKELLKQAAELKKRLRSG